MSKEATRDALAKFADAIAALVDAGVISIDRRKRQKFAFKNDPAQQLAPPDPPSPRKCKCDIARCRCDSI